MFALARKNGVFGQLDTVPLVALGRKLDWTRHRYNLDLTRHLDLDRL